MKQNLWTNKGDSAKKKAEIKFKFPPERTGGQLRRPDSRLLRYYAKNDEFTPNTLKMTKNQKSVKD